MSISIDDKKFKSLVQNSHDVISLLDKDGTVLYVSPAIQRMLKYSPQEMVGQSAFEYLHIDELEHVLELFEKLLMNPGGSVTMELRTMTKDNQNCWIEAVATNLLDDPNIGAIVVNYRDINERKLIQEELKQSEEKFRTSVENMLDAFAILIAVRNSEDKIVDFIFDYVNNAGLAQKYLGTKNFLGKNLSDIPLPKLGENLFDKFKDVVLTGVPYVNYNFKYYQSSGRNDCRIIEISASKLGNGITISWRDVTEKQLIEQRLIDSEARYRALAKNFPNGIVALFDKDLKYILVDGKGQSPIFNKENMEGKSIFELYSSGETEKLINYYKAVFEGIQSRFEIEFREKYFDVHLIPIKNETNEISAGMAMTQDVTKRKTIEKNLTQLNRDKDKFISIISHDLRSPFSSLLGISETLANNSEELSQSEIKELASGINNSSKTVFRLLENLLQWSRMKHGTIKFSPGLIFMDKIIREVLVLFHSNLQNKNITIKPVIEEGLFAYADDHMIKLVIRNLLSNAIKFSFKNSSIEIKAFKKENKINFQIKDYGIGMDEKTLQKLFKIDELVSSYGTEHESGSGLGLLLCKEFIEKNNGVLFIESKKGEGSKISFFIPSFDG